MQASILKQSIWSITKQNPITEIVCSIINIPIYAYGQGLLVVAVFLSALSCIYLKTLQREQTHRLQSAHQYTEQLIQRQNKLEVTHDTWSSPDRIYALGQMQGFVMPTTQDSISLEKQD